MTIVEGVCSNHLEIHEVVMKVRIVFLTTCTYTVTVCPVVSPEACHPVV